MKIRATNHADSLAVAERLPVLTAGVNVKAIGSLKENRPQLFS
jgi:hypothetical protein